MSRQQRIEQYLQQGLNPEVLRVENETANHNVPPERESHFRVTVVSDHFEGLTKVASHQLVYRMLNRELEEGLHALALHTFTPEQWAHKAPPPPSPECRGGSGSAG